MAPFKPTQTILNYIYNNQQSVIKHIRLDTQQSVATFLSINNMMMESISQSKLSHIIQYINENVEKSHLTWNLVLPEFKDDQTIVNYISEYSKIVSLYVDLVGQVATAKELTLINKSNDRITQTKLSHILSYVYEEIDNG